MGRHGGRKQRTSGLGKRSGARRHDWTVEAFGAPLGPGITAASLQEVLGAVEQLGEDLPWSAAADRVLPLFQRIRPYPPGFPEPVRHMLPSGLSVTFGVDAGPAFVHVSRELLDKWRTSVEAVADLALANLRRRATAVAPNAVLNESIADLPVGLLQSGTGAASTFVLLPDQLSRIFARSRALFIAPMRDLLIALPPETDPEVAAWLHAELAAPDPNCLAPFGYRLTNGRVTVEPLDQAVAIA